MRHPANLSPDSLNPRKERESHTAGCPSSAPPGCRPDARRGRAATARHTASPRPGPCGGQRPARSGHAAWTQTTASVDAPFHNPTDQDSIEIEVTDSRHPLFGRRLPLVSVSARSPHQVLSNQESLRLQYDLRQRALSLGWRDEGVAVIDADLGLSGAAATHREGFKDLIARVTLGQVGVVLSSEVTRLTRNCSDWYPLLDLCG